MRKEDKLKNMIQANKRFQERFNGESPNTQEEAFEYTPIRDANPQLTNLIQGL